MTEQQQQQLGAEQQIPEMCECGEPWRVESRGPTSWVAICRANHTAGAPIGIQQPGAEQAWQQP